MKRVVQTSLHRSLLAKGVHEVCKAIESKSCKFVVLANNCSEDTYKKLVEALAKQYQIPVLKVPEGETLGEWIGLSKFILKDKKVKSRKCSSLAIKDFAIEVTESERKLVTDRL